MHVNTNNLNEKKSYFLVACIRLLQERPFLSTVSRFDVNLYAMCANTVVEHKSNSWGYYYYYYYCLIIFFKKLY